MLRRRPCPILFPYTTLFRSPRDVVHEGDIVQLCLWQAYSVDPHKWRLRATSHSHTIAAVAAQRERDPRHRAEKLAQDRKSTRLNSSHITISYAVFCLKKKNK